MGYEERTLQPVGGRQGSNGGKGRVEPGIGKVLFSVGAGPIKASDHVVGGEELRGSGVAG